MRDLKALFRERTMKAAGFSGTTPQQLLGSLPLIGPYALRSVLIEYAPGDDRWEGHWITNPQLEWEAFPEWEWAKIYRDVGMEPPAITKKERK